MMIMKNMYFAESSKMASLLLSNYRLLYVLPCFDMGLGVGETSVALQCEKCGVEPTLFLLVCNLYTFEDYSPDTEMLTKIPLDGLMRFLRSSHKEYRENRMPQIISQILTLIDVCRIYHGEILMRFCEKYQQEVNAHFDYEEKIVFPYIAELLRGSPTDAYTIKDYKNSHSNLNMALDDLKNIIIKYLPMECTIERCRSVLVDLFLFESDLAKHTLLEDKILVSLVSHIENRLK